MCDANPWPRRPSIPSALFALGALLTAMRVILSTLEPNENLAWARSLGFQLALALLLTAACVVLVRHSAFLEPRAIFTILGLFGVLGVGLALLSLASQAQAAQTLSSTPISALRLQVAQEPSQTARGWWFLANVWDEERAVGKVWVSAQERPERGQVLSGVGRFSKNERDSWGIASTMRGVSGTINLLTVSSRKAPPFPIDLINALRAFLIKGVKPAQSEGRALIAGAALGERTALKAFGIDELFSQVGLAHLVAVSGFHSALLTTLVGQVLVRLSWPKTLRIASLGGIGALFCGLCGAPLSALRAFFMATLAQGADLLGRRAFGLQAVGLSGLAFILIDPACAGDMGFMLSVSCVCALGIFSRWITHGLTLLTTFHPKRSRSGVARKALGNAQSTFGAALLCSVLSFPLVAASFSVVPLLGPLAALALTPLFEPFLALAFGALLVGGVPLLGPLYVSAVSWLADGLLWLVRLFAAFPWGQQSVSLSEPWATLLVVAMMGTLYRLWPRPRAKLLKGLVLGAGAALIVALWVVPWMRPARVVVLDVGQGDAILIQEGAHALLVDSGPDESCALALARQQVRSLDAILLTHQHADHAGGVDSLVGSVAVGKILVPWGQKEKLGEGVEAAATALGAPIEEVRQGDVLHLGNFSLTVLWPQGAEDGDENNESLVCRLSYGQAGQELVGLLTGDAESDVLQALLQKGEVGDIDFLKVGHHGSKVSINEAEAKALDAELAVVSAGKDNSYGHPTRQCLETLKSSGATVFCTIEAGDVAIVPSNGALNVSTQKAHDPL